MFRQKFQEMEQAADGLTYVITPSRVLRSRKRLADELESAAASPKVHAWRFLCVDGRSVDPIGTLW